MARAPVTAEIEELPEADRLEPYPHPRETRALFGHETAERALAEALASGRMHHAWLLTGPRGIGKATLAYRFARFVLAHPDPKSAEVVAATDLSVSVEHPAFRKVAARAHPRQPSRRPLPSRGRSCCDRRIPRSFDS